MDMDEKLKRVASLGIYGIWLYKCSSYSNGEPFPPMDNKMIDMRGGGDKTKWDDQSLYFYQQGKKNGATHACIGYGNTCKVLSIDEVIQKVNKNLEWKE